MAVNSLSDLLKKIKKDPQIEVISFNGLELVTSVGRFTLSYEGLYLDNVVISKKKLASLLSVKLDDDSVIEDD